MNKAVFLDRDRTIIEDTDGYPGDPKQIAIIDGAAEAIKKLNESGFKVIVITNQSGVGRGYFPEQTVHDIHKKMTGLLSKAGARIDDIFYCPHHPEAKIAEYRVKCTCRKPLPGLILEAITKYNIDPSKSYIIGDEERDVAAGKTAGCKTILLSSLKQQTNSNFQARNLKEAVNIITAKTSTK